MRKLLTVGTTAAILGVAGVVALRPAQPEPFVVEVQPDLPVDFVAHKTSKMTDASLCKVIEDADEKTLHAFSEITYDELTKLSSKDFVDDHAQPLAVGMMLWCHKHPTDTLKKASETVMGLLKQALAGSDDKTDNTGAPDANGNIHL